MIKFYFVYLFLKRYAILHFGVECFDTRFCFFEHWLIDLYKYITYNCVSSKLSTKEAFCILLIYNEVVNF